MLRVNDKIPTTPLVISARATLVGLGVIEGTEESELVSGVGDDVLSVLVSYLTRYSVREATMCEIGHWR